MKPNGSDVPNARFYFASARPPAKLESLFLECERWFDARAVARALLSAEVDVGPSLEPGSFPEEPTPRVQVKWTGTSPHVTLEIRRVAENGQLGKWEPLR